MSGNDGVGQITGEVAPILQRTLGYKDDHPNQQDYRYPPTKDKTREHVQKDTESKEDHSGKIQKYIQHTHKQADNDSSTGKKLDNLAGSNPTSSLPPQSGQPQPQQGGQPAGGQPQPQQGGPQKSSDQSLADLLKDYEDKKDQENNGGIKHHRIKHNKRHHAAARNHEIVASHHEEHDHDQLSEDQKVGGLDEFTNQHGNINNETV